MPETILRKYPCELTYKHDICYIWLDLEFSLQLVPSPEGGCSSPQADPYNKQQVCYVLTYVVCNC